MKNIIHISIAALLFSVLSCGSNQIKEPDQIGKGVFEKLTTISTINKSEFITIFLSYNDIIEISKNEELSTSQEISESNKEEWDQRIDEDYNKLKSDAVELGIKWKEIEYLDFTFSVTGNKTKIEAYECKLYFMSGEDKYSLDIAALWTGIEYKIVIIGDLDKI